MFAASVLSSYVPISSRLGADLKSECSHLMMDTLYCGPSCDANTLAARFTVYP